MKARLLTAVPILLIAPAAPARIVPPGFDVQTVASGFTEPVAIALTVDGRMFVSEKRGLVWVVGAGDGPPTLFVDLSDEINGRWDRGLLGLALDPDFLSNRHVYLLYTVDPLLRPARRVTFHRHVQPPVALYGDRCQRRQRGRLRLPPGPDRRDALGGDPDLRAFARNRFTSVRSRRNAARLRRGRRALRRGRRRRP